MPRRNHRSGRHTFPESESLCNEALLPALVARLASVRYAGSPDNDTLRFNLPRKKSDTLAMFLLC